MDPSLTVPFFDNKTMQSYYFTNIFREADNGTKYHRRQMLDQHKELNVEKNIPDAVIKKETNL